MGINSSPKEDDISPDERLFGCAPLLLPLCHEAVTPQTAKDDPLTVIKDRLHFVQQNSSLHPDDSSSGTPYHIGQQVMVANFSRPHKLAPCFQCLFTITNMPNDFQVKIDYHGKEMLYQNRHMCPFAGTTPKPSVSSPTATPNGPTT